MASDCRFVYPNGSKVFTLLSSPPHPNLGSSESWRERQHQPSAIHNVFVGSLTHYEQPRMAMTRPNPSIDAVIASEPVASPWLGQPGHPRSYFAKS
ncbi:hypothetical protein B0T13DRAFT_485424 [Neurospora crassa]|nr:hypothetical protein B0T13DRAFT_485424 [Neurospora crassa]